jgi:hypothetical protein
MVTRANGSRTQRATPGTKPNGMGRADPPRSSTSRSFARTWTDALVTVATTGDTAAKSNA